MADSAPAVVRLDSYRASRSAERRSREFQEAMRRHPSFQSRMPSSAPALRLV